MSLTKRDVLILRMIDRFGYLSVNQIGELFRLKGSNRYRVVRRLERHCASVFHSGIKVLYLNKNGREVVGSSKPRRKTERLLRFLMRTDLYIKLGRPSRWRNDVRATKSGEPCDAVVWDAVFVQDDVTSFVFIDDVVDTWERQSIVKSFSHYIGSNSFKDGVRLVIVTQSKLRCERWGDTVRELLGVTPEMVSVIISK